MTGSWNELLVRVTLHLLRAGTADDWREAAGVVWERVFEHTPPKNAVIRDGARDIIEAAAARHALPPEVDMSRVLPPYESAWPLTWPDAKSTAEYEKRDYPKLVISCTGDDFFTYQIRPEFQDFPEITPELAARRLLGDVIDLGYVPSLHADFDREILSAFGPGRGKPKWIERIGKKYQWIALSRLVGVVSDNIGRTPEPWESPPAAGDPQGVRLRQLDPTFCEASPRNELIVPWLSYPWKDSELDADADWVADDGDFPDVPVENVLGSETVLNGSYGWDGQPRPDGNRRRVWAQSAAILVAEAQLPALLEVLKGRDLGGHELFRGPTLTKGFVGEYPFGSHHQVDLRTLEGEATSPFEVATLPTTYTLLGEYEYAPEDASVVSFEVPVPMMFGALPGVLRWDGASSWSDSAGRMVFSTRRAHYEDGRQRALTVDSEWLRDWLKDQEFSVVWIDTMGKDVHVPFGGKSPGRLIRTRVRYRQSNGSLAQLDPVSTRIGPSGP